MRIFLALIVALQPSFSYADRMSARSVEISDVELEAITKAAKRTKSYSSKTLDSSPTKSEQEELLGHFQQAQRLFLNDDASKSSEKYELIVSLSKKTDWSLGERQIIVNSYLRLAQLSPTEPQQKAWVREAVRFDNDIKPDKSLYPPPLRKMWDQILKEEEPFVRVWNVNEFKRDFTSIKINGKSYDLTKGSTIKLFPGTLRVHLISNRFKDIVRIMTAKQIMTLVPDGVQILAGECQHPLPPNIPDSSPILTIYGRDCIYEYSSSGFQRVSLSQISTMKTSREEKPSFDWTPPKNNLESSLREPPSESTTQVPWLTIGLITAGAAVVYAIVKSQEKPSDQGLRPTHE
jgi:hypothetical protein